MKYIFLQICILFSVFGFAQQKGKLWQGLEISYGHNLRNNSSFSTEGENVGNYYALRGRIGYYITPNLSLGGSLATTGQGNPSIDMYPLCFEARYHPFRNKKWILNGSIGYPLAVNNANITIHALSDISIGYTTGHIKNLSFVTSLGYNFCAFRNDMEEKKNDTRHSIYIKMGINF